MRESQVEDLFAQFEADVAGTFRPPGVGDAATRARRRRRTRGSALAGLAAMLFAVPAGAIAVASGGDGPPPTPRPAPTASPTMVERKVRLPGSELSVATLRFVDARHAWALLESCVIGTVSCPGGADHTALAATDDAGVTWRRVALPAGSEGPVNLYPLDARTLTVHLLGQRFLLTTDGGVTFSSHPLGSPPPQALRAAGAVQLRCPGATGFEDGASGVECERQRLVRAGSAAAPAEPALPGVPYQVVNGGDGRLWLVQRDGPRTQVGVSADAARTWRGLPPLPAAGLLTVSPAGDEVWYVDSGKDRPGRLWRLVGERWLAQPGVPSGTFDHNVVAAGAGVLAVAPEYGPAGLWTAGGFTPIPEAMAASGVEVLRDGTVVFYSASGRTVVVGVGVGADRTWTMFT